jgi:hypothetical protein
MLSSEARPAAPLSHSLLKAGPPRCARRRRRSATRRRRTPQTPTSSNWSWSRRHYTALGWGVAPVPGNTFSDVSLTFVSVDECVYTLAEMSVLRYEDPQVVYPEAWRPRPFERDHPICGGTLETVYVRATVRGRATWRRIGWRCKHCSTLWLDSEGPNWQFGR